MKRILHRVVSKRARKAPLPLPKEVTPSGPREYVDRFGVVFTVLWNGSKTDAPLSGIGR